MNIYPEILAATFFLEEIVLDLPLLEFLVHTLFRIKIDHPLLFLLISYETQYIKQYFIMVKLL